MKARTVATIVLAGTMAVASAALVAAQTPGGPGPMRGGGMRGPAMKGELGPFGRMLRHLDLTQEQRDKVKAILDAERPAIDALREKISAAQETFRAAHPVTWFDESALRAHLSEMAPLHADMAVAMARVRAKVLGVLTPEQLAKVEEMRAHRGEHGPEGGHGGWM